MAEIDKRFFKDMVWHSEQAEKLVNSSFWTTVQLEITGKLTWES